MRLRVTASHQAPNYVQDLKYRKKYKIKTKIKLPQPQRNRTETETSSIQLYPIAGSKLACADAHQVNLRSQRCAGL